MKMDGYRFTIINWFIWFLRIQVEYLGAEPPSITYGLVDSQEIDYEKMDAQYNELVEKIGNAANGKIQKITVSQESLKCSVSVTKELFPI